MKTKESIATICTIIFCLTGGYLAGKVLHQPLLEKRMNRRIDAEVKSMTLEEKCHFVVGTRERGLISDEEKAATDSIRRVVPGVAGTTFPLIRHDIPGILLADGPAGLRIAPTRQDDSLTYYCTGFPVGAMLASSWDIETIEEVGRAMGNEVLEYGVDVLLAPGLNIKRNPLCGRNFEYYSEDPLIVGKSAAAMVRGVQSNGVGTSIKHFAANNQEINRLFCDSRVSVRALREIYLKGFEIAVKEGEPWTVMSSYNYLNGPYTSENPELLQTVLRDEWGFDGLVMSDWGGGQHPAQQIAAGNDLIEPGRDWQYQEILDAVNDGTLSQEALDECVSRILELTYKTPRYKGYRYSNAPDLKAHAAVSRKAAGEGVVLLRNEDALPLPPGCKIAVFGRNDQYKLYAGGTGSGEVNKAYTVRLDEGLEAAGFSICDDADVAIFNLRRQAGEGTDRHVIDDFLMSGEESARLDSVCTAFHEAGKKVVVVINSGGVVETASWKDKVDAIVMAWMPGQEAGHVIADVLSGKVNPSGCLPETFPVSYESVPAQNFPNLHLNTGKNDSYYHQSKTQIYEIPNVDYTDYIEGIYVGYRYYTSFDVPVSYPFGYGLSYTSFAFSDFDAKLSMNKIKFDVTVTNVGSVSGRKVVQIYLARDKGCGSPVRELKAFTKTKELAPGESCKVEMEIPVMDMASFDEQGSRWLVKAGHYTFELCDDSQTVMLDTQIKLGRDVFQGVNRVLEPEGELFIGKYDDNIIL